MGKIALVEAKFKEGSKEGSGVVTINIINNIVVSEKAVLRPHSPDRISDLAQALKDKGEFETPIVVAPYQGISTKYWLIDGYARYKAAQAAGISELQAQIRNEIIVPDGDRKDIVKAILYHSALLNWRHYASPLSWKERKNCIRRLYQMGYTPQELTTFASLTSIYVWLGDLLEESKNELKEKCINLVNEGKTQQETSRLTGVPQRTVSNWIQSEESDKNKGLAEIPNSEKLLNFQEVVQRLNNNSLINNENITNQTEYEDEAITDEPVSESLPDTPPTLSQHKITIEEIYDALNSMKWTRDVDETVVDMLLPLLSKRSSNVRKVIGNGDYISDANHVKLENSSLQEQLRDVTRQLSEVKKENNILKANQQRQLNCNQFCEYLEKSLRKKFDNRMGPIVEDAIRHFNLYLNFNEDELAAITRTTIARIETHIEEAYHDHVLADKDIRYINEFIENVNKINTDKEVHNEIKRAIERVAKAKDFFHEE